MPQNWQPAEFWCLAPEITQNKQQIGLAIDIWNFGLIYFELITGQSLEYIIKESNNSKELYNYMKNNKTTLLDILNHHLDCLMPDKTKVNRSLLEKRSILKKIAFTIFINSTKIKPNKRSKISEIVDSIFQILDMI